MARIELSNIEKLILNLLAKQILTAEQIVNYFRLTQTEFGEEQIYPLLTKLGIKKYLCSGWKKDSSDEMQKFYFITTSGKNFIHQ